MLRFRGGLFECVFHLPFGEVVEPRPQQWADSICRVRIGLGFYDLQTERDAHVTVSIEEAKSHALH